MSEETRELGLRARAAHRDRAAERSLAFLQALFAGYRPRDFAVRLWDGTTWEAEPGQHARFTLVFRHPGALRRMFWRGSELSVAEAYLCDDFDVEGDVGALFGLADYLLRRGIGGWERLGQAKRLLALPRGGRACPGRQPARLKGALHSRDRDRAAIAYHYDVSNEFFALWLDRCMVYSCAYFATSEDDLERAQEQKLDHICRKLQLRPGQRLLDIGCGWGGLAMRAAERYGVEVLGVTLSQKQAELAQARIAAAGLAGRCRVELRDYRDLDAFGGFDRVASVGMFEHVGEARLAEYFRGAWQLLRPGGIFLNHAIAFSFPEPRRKGPSFFGRYVFPDGELLPLSTTLRAAEASGFEVRDVESLREHYALTLRHWRQRLEAQRAGARRIADEATYRVWRLYLAAAAHQFITGRTTLYQTLLAKRDGGRSEMPLTRAAWYAASGEERRPT